MTKYRIYTTNDTKPFIIETNGDLLNDYIHAMEFNHPTMSIWHKKDMQALGGNDTCIHFVWCLFSKKEII